MRQVLVLRIHADCRLVLAELGRSQRSLEGVVVALSASHLQWFNAKYALLAILVDEDPTHC